MANLTKDTPLPVVLALPETKYSNNLISFVKYFIASAKILTFREFSLVRRLKRTDFYKRISAYL